MIGRFAPDSTNRSAIWRKLRGKATSCSRCRRPASRLPASRLSAGPNEALATWAFPSLSPMFHQAANRPVSAHPLQIDIKFTLFVMRVAADSGSGLMKRSEKPGSDPIFGDGISPSRGWNGKRRNEQRRKSMSHPRAFPTSERESGVIRPQPLPRTRASLQHSDCYDQNADRIFLAQVLAASNWRTE